MIDFCSFSPYFANLRDNLNDKINITIGDESYNTSRLLLISHSDKLKDTFGDPNKKSFMVTDDIDPIAFGRFIEFINNNKINSLKYEMIDNLLKVANFYKADLFRDYLVMNLDFIEYQFHQISIYENQGKSTDFLIDNLSSRIFEIVEKWNNVHKVDLYKLLQILQRSNLNQFPPEMIFSFCLKSIKYRGSQSIEILKLFNLSKLPFQQLLILQKTANENNVSYEFFEQIKKLEQDKKQLQINNANLLNQLQNIERMNKNEDDKISIEFKAELKQNKSVEIKAIPTNCQNNNNSRFLVLVIGKEKVGKTTFINQYYIMNSEKKENLNDIKVNFLDFTDDEILFASVLKVQMFLFICSPDIKGSTQFCQAFYEKALKIKNTDAIPSIVYWNKSDLEESTVEDIEEAKEFAKNINSELILASAKTSENLMNINEEIVKKLKSQDQKSCSIF